MSRWALACLLLVGCSGAETPCVDPARSHAVALHSSYPFTEYRVEGGAWEAPLSLDADHQMLCVDDAYTVMVQCKAPFANTIEQYSAVVDDGPLELYFCIRDRPEDAALVTVSGQMAQPGEVSVGGSGVFGFGDPWDYAIETFRTTEDIVAIEDPEFSSGPPRILIRRRAEITDDRTEPLLDLDDGGIPAVRIDLAVPNLADDETVTVSNTWLTDGFFSGHGGAAQVTKSLTHGITIDTVPAELLAPGDNQDVTLSASTGDHDRGFDSILAANSTFELMPRLDGIELRRDDVGQVATWALIPIEDYDRVSFQVAADGVTIHQVFATRQWIERTGATSLELDASSPRFDPAWRITKPAFESFEIERKTELATFWTGVSYGERNPGVHGPPGRGRSTP